MIPSVNGFLNSDFIIEEQPSYTYKLTNKIGGYIDSQEAIIQTIYCILNTERYQYMIYSWNYGIELIDLIGEPVNYVMPELKRRIIEALTWDKRIIEVNDFTFDVSKNEISCKFTVYTIYGEVQIQKVVNF
ncbi:MAG: DUF2634 domain-containing protein [Oscillospiraceae bacterium]|nr:DUF2634 domain-containing protein [Oscillospiraceae bacterium]